MYASFFGLKEMPFNPTPDPRYFYLSPSHEEALAQLVYGIQEKQGLMVVTGMEGTGKTTLLHTLLEHVESSVKLAFVYYPKLRFQELLQFIFNDLGLQTSATTTAQYLVQLRQFLIDRCREGETIVLVIDEAQDLFLSLLDDMRALNNLETAKKKLLQIILVGRPELQHKLHLHLRQRIRDSYEIHPLLSYAETKAYIQHRLSIAGGNVQSLFTPRALKAIHAYAEGIPRLINTVCDQTLLTGYAEGQQRITAQIVRRVIRNLELRTRKRVRATHLQKAAVIVTGLLLLSATVLASPQVQTSLQHWYELIKMQIENSLSSIFDPNGNLAGILHDQAVPMSMETQAVAVEARKEPPAASTVHEEAFVADAQPVARASPSAEVIQQVMALIYRFFPDGGAFALQVWPNKGRDAVYTAGEKMWVDIVAESDAYLQVDYYQADGQVVHLLPNVLDDNRVEAGKTFTLGKPKNSFQFQISPPFGVEMLAVIASQQPLEVQRNVPSVELASSYLERLARSLENYQAHAQVAVAYTRIRTQEQVEMR
jgi:general secretion pathway protein A